MSRLTQIQAFKAELIALAEEGITLDDATIDRIRAHHGALLADAPDDRLSLGMRVASFIGAVALSAAIFFLFYRFWGGMPTAGQLTLLLVAPVALLALTELLHRWERTGYFAALAALTACAAFVLDLTALGDIYNLPPTPHAFLAWGAFALLVGLAYEIRLPHLMGVVCIGIWLISLPGVIEGQMIFDGWERPEAMALTGALFLGIAHLRAPRMAQWRGVDLRVAGMFALFLGLLMLGTSGRKSWFPFDRDTIQAIYQVIGFAVAALVTAWGVRGQHRDLVNGGMSFFIILCLVKAFDWWWEFLPRWAFFLVIAAFAIGVMIVLRRIHLRTIGRAP